MRSGPFGANVISDTQPYACASTLRVYVHNMQTVCLSFHRDRPRLVGAGIWCNNDVVPLCLCYTNGALNDQCLGTTVWYLGCTMMRV